MQAFVFAVVGYGYIATAVCVLVGPFFIPWFIVPKMDWLFWGWFKAFIGFSFTRSWLPPMSSSSQGSSSAFSV